MISVLKTKFFGSISLKSGLFFMFLMITFCSLFMGSFDTFAATVEDRVDDFIYNKEKPEKVVYLTFDDGPSRYSLEILDVLDQYDVPAIFFVIGENIEMFSNAKEILTEMVERGHYIGLHSMTHNMDSLYHGPNAPQNFVKEMLADQKMVYDLTEGFTSQLCRPPYGGRNHLTREHYVALEEAGITCIDWNVDSLDWSKSSADQIFRQVVAEQKRNQDAKEVVLLFHEKKFTLEVLSQVIEYYRSLGYEFMSYCEGEDFNCTLSNEK